MLTLAGGTVVTSLDPPRVERGNVVVDDGRVLEVSERPGHDGDGWARIGRLAG